MTTPGSNGFDPEKVKRALTRIHNLEEQKLSVKMTAARECKAISEDMNQLYKDVKAELGIPKKVLKGKVDELQLRAKADGIREKFDVDDQDVFDLVSQAVEGFEWTPLGQAAAAAVQKVEVQMRAAADGVEKVEVQMRAAADGVEIALGKEKKKRKATTAEERVAKRIAATSGKKQADLEDAAKAAAEKDEASGGEVVEFVSKTHAERSATNGTH